jgi:hypothetical protein
VSRIQVSMSALIVLAVAVVVPASAQTKGIITFGGLKNLQFIGNYYDGGGGNPDLGVDFSGNAQAIVQATKGGSGNFINNPGGYPVMFFQTGNSVTMNAKNGIGVAIWFSYSALKPGTVTVYDGANGAGTVLANITLNPNNTGCNTYAMCVWTPVAIPLTATAASIKFGGTANYVAIGSIHLGQLLTTTTTVTSSQDPNQPCASAVFTAAVVGIGGAVPNSSQNGLVTFAANGKVLAKNVALVNGVATATASLSSGSTVAATFKKTVSFNGSRGTMTVQCTP